MAPDRTLPDELPLVGRAALLEELRSTTLAPRETGGGLVLVHGEQGVGKTRLASMVLAQADREGWTVIRGQGYPMDSEVPYGLAADALVPFLSGLDDSTITVLTRGAEDGLYRLFPALRPSGHVDSTPSATSASELRTRAFWTLSRLLRTLAERDPLILAWSDVHWADPSSIQLIQFLARTLADAPVRLVLTASDPRRGRHVELRTVERALAHAALLTRVQVPPLGPDDLGDLLERTFHVAADALTGFTGRLHRWTAGNPSFATETLRAMVAEGTLRREAGTWVGWEADPPVPPSVRSVAEARLAPLSDDARRVASIVSAARGRIEFDVLRRTWAGTDRGLLSALEEAGDASVLRESADPARVIWEFTHPFLGRSIYDGLSRARRQVIHGELAAALEPSVRRSPERIHELATHLLAGGGGPDRSGAAAHLVRAGFAALDRYADREAVQCLTTGLDWLEEAGGPGEANSAARPGERLPGPTRIRRKLARAHQRLGSYDEARSLWNQALQDAQAAGESDEAGRIHRYLGLAALWAGRHCDALEHFGLGLTALDDDAGRVPLLLARGSALQRLARVDEARRDLEGALEAAETAGAPGLRARALRSLAVFHTWAGNPERAREHARAAIDHAETAGEPSVEFWSLWALAVLEGLTGNAAELDALVDRADAVAARVASPILPLYTAELRIERAFGSGRWSEGLVVGERAIHQARTLNQNAVLTRLLVWTSLIYTGRGEYDRARALTDEAWALAGADAESPDEIRLDVHRVVPAHIGRAALEMHRGDTAAAMKTARRGLEIADRTGFAIWAIHHLIPILVESAVREGEFEAARELPARLRRDAARFDHALGLAWAEAADALVAWFTEGPEAGAVGLRHAAERLETIPMLPDSVRIRRQLAGRLADIGDRDGALRELRRVHDIFAELGDEAELRKARDQFRELESRPPVRSGSAGAGSLTPREVDIARLVARRKSNKAAARELGISHRTVGTHLSNIFKKLDLGTRNQLADFVRRGGLDHLREGD